MSLMSVSVYNKNFQRIAILDTLVSYTTVEHFRDTGTFTMWVQATAENMETLVQDNVVEFEFESTASTEVRNLVLSGNTVYQVNNTVSYEQLLNYSAYKISSDADRILNGQYATLSVHYTALNASIATGGYVRVVIPYTIGGVAQQITFDLSGYVITNGSNTVSMTVPMGSGVLVFGDIQVLINQVRGSLAIDELNLVVGQTVQPYTPAPENDMTLKYPNTLWGLVVARIVKKEDNFSGLEVHGKLLDDVLRWRCIWQKYLNTDTVPAVFADVVDKNFINPALAERAIPWVAIENSVIPDATMVSIERVGGYVSDLVYSVLPTAGLGLKAIYDKRSQKVRLYLYRGKNRSTAQSELPYVVFSEENGLLINPTYTEDNSSYKNVAIVNGEISNDPIFVVVGTTAGENRREVYVQTNNSNAKKEDGTEMTVEEYTQVLFQQGAEKLEAYSSIHTLESKVHSQAYEYGKDYTLGDTVTIIYGSIGVAYHAPIETVTRSGAGAEEDIELSFGKGVMTFGDKVKLRLG